MRIIFLGTPEFAVPSLLALLEDREFTVAGVVTQPDRPSGRGNKLKASPVKELSLEHHLPVFQPEKLAKAPETVEAMSNLNPDVLVTAAFGQILKKSVLTMAPLGVINVHASLLPAYRGAAPINWAIINGESTTGVTTMQTEQGIDTGPMFLSESIDIGEETTAEDLSRQLAPLGARVLLATLHGLKDGTLKSIPQDEDRATLAPMLKKELSTLNWQQSAATIHNLVRGLHPWPGTTTTFRGQPIKIVTTRSVLGTAGSACAPGELSIIDNKVIVHCGDGNQCLEILAVQPPGKAKMAARDWANGARLSPKERLGSPP